MTFDWSEEKNRNLQKDRQISFSEIIVEIEAGNFRIQSPHPKKEKYPDQILLYVLVNEYIYVVPAVPSRDGIFLKTIYPSRKQTKEYKEGRLEI
jgi:uncharacterized DUF497 family protein